MISRRRFSNFNPRSPCGERPGAGHQGAGRGPISIHAPRVGSDRSEGGITYGPKDFNPRSPCGERRESYYTLELDEEISIHAPRVGSDWGVAALAQ